jgi:nucleoside-diphosphate-sugar epimerase
VKQRRERIADLAYASSAAVYDVVDAEAAPGRDGRRPPDDSLRRAQARERGHGARLLVEDGLPSIGLRPYIVYGPGRDTGMTAGPTLAWRPPSRGEPYTIAWSSRSTFNVRT